MEPRISEIRPGIFHFPGRKPSCHSYLVRGNKKNMLIDTGLPQYSEYITACLASLGLKLSDIHLVILTHEHIDHIGSAPLFADSSVIAAHTLAANKIALQDEFVMMNRHFSSESDPFQVDWCMEGESTIELGNYSFRIIHTPGHSSGCICVYEPEKRFLFTGDTIMAGGGIAGIFGSGSISDYIKTLKKLSALRVDEFYPGHGWLSKDPENDFKIAISRASTLLDDSKVLFEALKHRDEHFSSILASAKGFNK